MKFQTRPGAELLLQGSQDSPRKQRVHMAGPFSSDLPVASISANLIRSLGNAGSDGLSRKEKATGIEFPYEFCFSHKPCPQLAGLGVRAKRLLGIKNINVYSLGVYVDGAAAKKALGHRFKGSDEAALAKDQQLFDSLMASDSVEKTLRLVIAFGHLRRAQFVEALEERLAPPLKQAGEAAALEEFKHYFDKVEFHKGLEITFTQPAGGPLVTQVGGKEVGRTTNKALSSALWGIYLGPDPVSPDTKASLGATLAATLHQH